MPKFTVETNSAHSAEQTYSKLKDFLSNDSDLRKLDGKYSCEFDDASFSGSAKGGQFTADLKVEPQASGAKVAITVELPFMLGFLKPKVTQILQEKLSSTLA